jgi:hypothetical protein
MATILCIAGESGTGKTTSMRNLNPETTFYIDSDKKGLSWKGWREQYNGDRKNYLKTDFAQIALSALKKINDTEEFQNVEVVVIDTINGLMIADEMRRVKEKGYDKWQDLAQSIYELIDYALTMRDGLTVVFVAHTQTDHDDNGYMFTRIKTSGRKLDKITLESKFPTVLLAKCKDGNYVFETHANFSTAKSPLGAFEENEIENDVSKVIEILKEY